MLIVIAPCDQAGHAHAHVSFKGLVLLQEDAVVSAGDIFSEQSFQSALICLDHQKHHQIAVTEYKTQTYHKNTNLCMIFDHYSDKLILTERGLEIMRV